MASHSTRTQAKSVRPLFFGMLVFSSQVPLRRSISRHGWNPVSRGAIDVAHTTVDSVDGQVGTISVGESGEYSAYKTVALDARRGGVPVEATFLVRYGDDLLDPFTVQGTTVDVELLLRTITETTEGVADRWDIEATVTGSPVAVLTVDSPAAAPTVLTINVLINQAPDVQLTEPFAGQRVMEGDSIRASASFTDDMDGTDALVVSWRVYDMQGNAVLQGGNEPVFNITDLTAGFYIVEVKVTDTFGEEATASMDFEYTLLDTDNDWSSSCSSDTWFDPNTGKSCGPNIYDQDDDNDGFSDEKDAFRLFVRSNRHRRRRSGRTVVEGYELVDRGHGRRRRRYANP